MLNEQLQKEIDTFMNKLSEHTESVRIFITASNPNGGTSCFTTGRGNYYAQAGQIDEWRTTQDEVERDSVRTKNN